MSRWILLAKKLKFYCKIKSIESHIKFSINQLIRLCTWHHIHTSILFPSHNILFFNITMIENKGQSKKKLLRRFLFWYFIFYFIFTLVSEVIDTASSNIYVRALWCLFSRVKLIKVKWSLSYSLLFLLLSFTTIEQVELF